MPKAAKAKAKEAPSLVDLQAKKDRIAKIKDDIDAARTKFEASLANRTKELERLERELVQGLQGELRQFGGTQTVAAARPARVAAGTPGSQRSPKVASKKGSRRGSIDEDAILAVVRDNPRIGSKKIREKAGVTATSNSLSVRLRKMVDDGKLTKTGEKAQTRYSAK
jgi:hypothetical protein